jgi:hypothetical protein
MLNYTTHLLTTEYNHRIPRRLSGSLKPGTGNTAHKIRPVERVAVSLFLSFFLLFQLKRARTLCRRSADTPVPWALFGPASTFIFRLCSRRGRAEEAAPPRLAFQLVTAAATRTRHLLAIVAELLIARVCVLEVRRGAVFAEICVCDKTGRMLSAIIERVNAIGIAVRLGHWLAYACS